MTRRAPPQPGVDRMVSTSWSGRRWSSPAARQGRALARGLEGHLPLQHHHVSDQNSSSSRCWAYFSLAFKHGIYRDWVALGAGPDSVCCYGDLEGVGGSGPGIGGLAGFVQVGEVQAMASLAADGPRP